jgi:putative radical SAM enzyme (TIGR03279 family)
MPSTGILSLFLDLQGALVNNVRVNCSYCLKAVIYLSKPDLLTVTSVAGGSIAEKVGFEKGDKLVTINDNPVNDIIDYHLLTCDEYLKLEVRKPSGERWIVDIKKDDYESLGLTFEKDIPMGLKRCSNNCIFCFIDQLPPGLRETLYVKDDDYRHSFLYGNYISLTNLSQADWERIKRMRLSPLYVSVHTTNPRLRSKMFRNPRAGRIMDQLRELVSAGITLHAQVVVCPGINDGSELDTTLHDLASLWPEMSSVSVVPVGITKYQKFDYPFFPVDRTAAEDIINRVERIQKECNKTLGYNFVFAADELYLKAGRVIPPAEYYEDYPQLENGVGTVRLFIDEMAEIMEELPARISPPRRSLVITGVSAAELLKHTVRKLNDTVSDLDARVLPVSNQFFGPSVTVTGLLTGQDITVSLERYLREQQDRDIDVILSSVLLKADEEVFLDGYTVDDVKKRTGVNLIIVENSARGLIQGTLGLEVL